jgi:putative FmdB family regulatory protein
MPMYEYQAVDVERSCPECRRSFEIIQSIREPALTVCRHCGHPVKKIISRCHGAVMETPAENIRVTDRIKEYERQGLWSHAAELADKHSEKVKDNDLKTRALDNYKKAGYDTKLLDKHDKSTL